jgi:hypothetical protein
MSEKTDLLKELAVLAETLGREPVTSGTVVELRGKRTELLAEVADLNEEFDDDESGQNTPLNSTTGEERLMSTETTTVTQDQAKITTPPPLAVKGQTDKLTRFEALATLHVNAISDNGTVVPVVVKGQSAQLPLSLFNTLLKSKLVKRA